MERKLDLNSFIKKGTVELAAEEHPDERAARLRREEKRDIREHHLFYIVTVALVSVGVACLWAGFFATTLEPEARAWSRTALTSLVSGGVWFLFGRALPRG